MNINKKKLKAELDQENFEKSIQKELIKEFHMNHEFIDSSNEQIIELLDKGYHPSSIISAYNKLFNDLVTSINLRKKLTEKAA